ncbi:SCO family protein [Virgibacillus sp. W0181]|uniref:SCO family protein n=1 Tax=Virgibacillus sp. W0181 TaxID=3391581 RepID=UPI003F45C6D8
MKKKIIITVLVFIGFVAVYILWPRTVALPKLVTIKDPHLPAITGEIYTFSPEKPKLVTFLYTSCPDVCPMTVMDLMKLQQSLENREVSEQDYDVILITLDPEVDTVEKIEQYKGNFNITAKNWHFLRGTVHQTQEITKQFNMAYKKDSDGLIVHGTKMYLLDGNNWVRAYHDMNTGNNSVDLELLAENITALID